jgi:hypothetical protein
MAEAKIEVTVEQSIHVTISEVAQRIYDAYGIKLGSVVFDWRDVSTISTQRHVVNGVSILSTSLTDSL